MAAKSQPAWDVEPGHLTAAELEFLAEDQLITIMPLTSHPQFNLIQWMTVEQLEGVLKEERDQTADLALLPFHYLEIASTLLQVAPMDMESPERIRTLIADIEAVRKEKVAKAMGDNIAQDRGMVDYINMYAGIGAIELMPVRTFFSDALDVIYENQRSPVYVLNFNPQISGKRALEHDKQARLNTRNEALERTRAGTVVAHTPDVAALPTPPAGTAAAVPASSRLRRFRGESAHPFTSSAAADPPIKHALPNLREGSSLTGVKMEGRK